MSSLGSGWVGAFLDRMLGRGSHAVTVPPMDGPLRPNSLLDQAGGIVRIEAPDNLTLSGDQLVFSSGPEVLALDPATGALRQMGRMEGEVCAMTALANGAALAAISGGGLRTFGDAAVSAGLLADAERRVIRCPTALLAGSDGRLLVAEGARDRLPSQWRADLLCGKPTGALWMLDRWDAPARPLASGLAWPSGIAWHRDGSIVVSEAWAHRLVRIDGQGRRSVLLGDLPGYPSRISPAADGGWWLCLFAPRSQLVEFVLREREYCERMMAQIPERYWVAPALASGRDFREPMQGGGIKSMGRLKPWAPTRSYGLVCKLDADFQPLWSAHSRADGRRHGVTSVAELGGCLYVGCQGSDEIVSMNLQAQQ
ncbi:strictosidine synthase [Variovorax sp. PBS-H4]|uniref:strictosidine synthase n=1 Tax=Variovorax sp. PBS-H4 TaxID=434008 RepID=UPI0013A5A33C|nr:strictosidine synthase [Variovorax sp. PBS-H4]